MLKEKVGVDSDKKLKLTSLMDYKGEVSMVEKVPSTKKIAIVYAEGNVGYGKHEKGRITEGEYIKIFSKIRRDDKIKAVVLRVNSGGGSALTSDIIWDEETINALFDKGPDHYIPGSKMPMQRITKSQDRDDLVAFLRRATAPEN